MYPMIIFPKEIVLVLLLIRFSFVECCGTFRFKTEDGVALAGHVISNITTNWPIKCHLECVNFPTCMSVNTRQNEAGKTICEMNNSSKAANPQDMEPRPGYQYRQMTEIDHCTTEICHHREALPDGWFRFGSKLLKFFPEKKTWGQAQNICQALGGGLASIHSERENEFMFEMFVNNLTNITKPDSSELLAHWPLDGTDMEVRLKNGTKYVAEDGVKSLFIDGSSAGSHAKTPAVKFGNTSFTIAAWVKLVSPVGSVSVIYGDPMLGSFSLIISYMPPAARLRYQIYTNGGLDQAVYKDYIEITMETFHRFTLIEGQWFHVVVSWDPGNNTMHASVNGSKNVMEAGPNNHQVIVQSLFSFYDIGFAQPRGAMRGHLRDLTIIGKVLNEEELQNIKVQELFPEVDGVWIGLNDITTEGTFQWIDGSHVTYNRWASSQPNNENGYQNCVQMTGHGGEWNDEICGKYLPFICEKIA